uniref:Beclin 1 n=1 Tax=Plectus sambesii TaxID=2011161 RepID=A0A914X6X1_9BILA
MCQDCTDKLLDGMDSQLKALEDECAEYRRMLDGLRKDRSTNSFFDVNASKIELNKLKGEEKMLRSELSQLEIEERELETQLNEEARRGAGVAKEDERLWRAFRDVSRKLLDLETDEQSAAAQLVYTRAQLDKLSKTNVFNLTFHIWHSGRFGTINGFRLGRLPDDQVEWNEINAAWGQTVLLLKSLAKRIDFQFTDYEPVPMGSASYVKCLSADAKDKELPLYCVGGYKFLGHPKFDSAMVIFLDCLRQLQSEIERNGGFHLPHAMQRDKIEDQGKEYSVKTQFNSEERWTKAMKCLLTNLKWALAWVASLQP